MRRAFAVLSFLGALAAALATVHYALRGVQAPERSAPQAPQPPAGGGLAAPPPSRHRRGGGWGRRFLILLGVTGVALVGVGAWAFWSAGSASGSDAQGVAASVDQVTGLALGAGAVTPTADPDVPLTWNPALLSNGHAIDGYLVRRYAGSTPTSVCGSDPTPLGSVDCTDSSVPDGTYSYGVSARFDSWTGPESSRISVTVDTSAPTISGAPQSPSANASPSFTFTQPSYSTFKCKLDGAASFTPCTSPDALSGLADGPHTFRIEALDANGVATRIAVYAWTIDTSPPVLGGTPSDPSANASPSFALSDVSYPAFRCSLDGAGFSSCPNPAPLTGLADGSHTFRVEAVDADGVATHAATFSWNVSSGSPTIPTKPSDASASPSPAFAFAHADYSSFVCQLDGSGTFNSAHCSPAGLADGNHTLAVKAQAADGSLTSAASYAWKVSTAAPTIATEPHSPSANPAPTFAFSHGDYASFVCRLDSSGSFTSGQCTPSALGSGSHMLDVKAQAADGSETAAASYGWTVDASAPTIKASPHDPSADRTPTFGFTHAQAGYTFRCQTDGGGFSACPSPTTLSSLGNGSHTFQVEAVDTDGFPTAGTGYTWTVDASAPTITAAPTSHSADPNPSFSFSHAQAGYTFKCQLDGGGYGVCTSPKAYSGLAGGSREFDVEAVDADGVATAPAVYDWTIDTSAPTITPTTSMVAGGTYASQSAGFGFGHAIYSSFQCFLDGGSFATCTDPTDFGSLADGSHTVTAAAVDGNGIATHNATFSWTVEHGAPAITSDPSSPTSSTSATFDFSEAPYSHFECELDGGGFIDCDGGTVSYSGLSGAGPSGATHTFTVHAVDSLGASTADQTFTWTVDTTAPTVDVELASGQSGSTSSLPIHFTATFDEPVQAFSGGVTLGGTADHSSATVTVTQTTSSVYDIAVSGVGSGTVTASVNAGATTDLAGNANVASTSTDDTVTYTP